MYLRPFRSFSPSLHILIHLPCTSLSISDFAFLNGVVILGNIVSVVPKADMPKEEVKKKKK
jgi:hypothetical protein